MEEASAGASWDLCARRAPGCARPASGVEAARRALSLEIAICDLKRSAQDGDRAVILDRSTREASVSVLSSVDLAGRPRSPATFSEFHLGRAPGNKGMRYPADPPRVEEIVAIMRQAGDGPSGERIRGLIVVLVARRAAHPGGARPARARPRPASRRAARP